MIVLRALVQHPGTTSAELAARLNLDRVMVARRLPDLEALGYVSREGINRKPAVGGAGVMWKPTPEGIAAWSRARGSA